MNSLPCTPAVLMVSNFRFACATLMFRLDCKEAPEVYLSGNVWVAMQHLNNHACTHAGPQRVDADFLLGLGLVRS